MIIARLRGGLGNQLFQYSAGRALADHHNTQLKLDLYTYSRHSYRKFELHHFQIDAEEASRKEVHVFTGDNPIRRYLNKKQNYIHCPNVFAQPHYHFYEDFFKLPQPLYISGYWQSEKYFKNIGSILRKELMPKVPLDERNIALRSKLVSENSISVHVRRGDFTKISYSNFFGLLEKNFYDRAISRMAEEVSQPVFYFFSDDPEWCRSSFTNIKAEFIDHNSGDDSFKDLLLMSSCKHNIIANSTFSWWGAWLNPHPDKKVIAPERWFRGIYQDAKNSSYASRIYNTRDVVPESWIKL